MQIQMVCIWLKMQHIAATTSHIKIACIELFGYSHQEIYHHSSSFNWSRIKKGGRFQIKWIKGVQYAVCTDKGLKKFAAYVLNKSPQWKKILDGIGPVIKKTLARAERLRQQQEKEEKDEQEEESSSITLEYYDGSGKEQSVSVTRPIKSEPLADVPPAPREFDRQAWEAEQERFMREAEQEPSAIVQLPPVLGGAYPALEPDITKNHENQKNGDNAQSQNDVSFDDEDIKDDGCDEEEENVNSNDGGEDGVAEESNGDGQPPQKKIRLDGGQQ